MTNQAIPWYTDLMKKIVMIMGLTAVALLIACAPVFAAASVTAGSIGQRANDASTFGIAVCNTGDAAQTASVPVAVTANGTTISAQSASPIAAGTCAYTYLSYASFAMVGGHAYPAQVSVNSGAPSAYTINVPGSVLGASAVISTPDQARANLMATEIVLLKQLIVLLQKKLGL